MSCSQNAIYLFLLEWMVIWMTLANSQEKGSLHLSELGAHQITSGKKKVKNMCTYEPSSQIHKLAFDWLSYT